MQLRHFKNSKRQYKQKLMQFQAWKDFIICKLIDAIDAFSMFTSWYETEKATN